MFRGTSEPIVIATAVWSVDRLLARRHGQAFAVMVAGGLLRPEWWPFLGLYGLWLWFKVPGLRPLVVAGFVAQPLLWFVPPWIGSGQPFLAAAHAREYNGHLGSHPVLTADRAGLRPPSRAGADRRGGWRRARMASRPRLGCGGAVRRRGRVDRRRDRDGDRWLSRPGALLPAGLGGVLRAGRCRRGASRGAGRRAAAVGPVGAGGGRGRDSS